MKLRFAIHRPSKNLGCLGIRLGKNVYIDFVGQTQRARIVAATKEEGTFQIQGSRMPISWSRIAPRRIADIATKYTSDPDHHIVIAMFLAACGETDRAQKAVEKAIACGPTAEQLTEARRLGNALR